MTPIDRNLLAHHRALRLCAWFDALCMAGLCVTGVVLACVLGAWAGQHLLWLIYGLR